MSSLAVNAASSSPAPSTRGRFWIYPVILILTAGIAYHGSFRGPLIFDDVPAITDNASIRHLWPLSGPLSPPRENVTSGGLTVSGRPVANLSLAINYALNGIDPRGYHVMNFLIHLAAGLVLFGITRRTLLLPSLRARFGTTASPLALIASMLWLVHPLQTESVTYIVQRVESLMGLFYLLTLYCFIRGIDTDVAHTSGSRRSGIGWKIGTVVACGLGMGCKEVMVTAPIVVLLYDRTFVAGSFRQVWSRRGKFFVALAATWIVLAVVLLHAGGSRAGSAGFELGITWWQYAFTQCEALVRYLWLSIWPHGLTFDYGTRLTTSPAVIIPCALIVIALLIAVATGTFRNKRYAFAGCWFFLILAPSSSVVPVATQVMAEHRMYLPLAGIIITLVLGLYAWLGPKPCIITGLVLASAFTWLTIRRNADYATAIAIWTDTVAKRPDNSRARENLGLALADAGQINEAREQFAAVKRLGPDHPDIHNNLGIACAKAGRIAEAIAEYNEALRLNPSFTKAHQNLGNALLAEGRPSEAQPHFEAAVRLQPEFAEAHANLAFCLYTTGHVPEAIAQYETAVRLNPDFISAHYSLGSILLQTGRPGEAIPHFEAVLRLSPDYADANARLEAARGAISGHSPP